MTDTFAARGKLKLVAVEPDGTRLTVEAQFNPKEIQVDKSVPWQKQQRKGPADLEYTGCEPRTMSLELLFDGFEEQQSIVPQIKALHTMTQHFGTKPQEKRPPKLRVVWGPGSDESLDLPRFTAVIESLSVKYTMFSPDGKALRATASVKLKEADSVIIGSRR